MSRFFCCDVCVLWYRMLQFRVLVVLRAGGAETVLPMFRFTGEQTSWTHEYWHAAQSEVILIRTFFVTGCFISLDFQIKSRINTDNQPDETKLVEWKVSERTIHFFHKLYALCVPTATRLKYLSCALYKREAFYFGSVDHWVSEPEMRNISLNDGGSLKLVKKTSERWDRF